MRIVAQRVTHASVTIDGKVKSEIGLGMLILLGIEEADNEEDIEWLCQKLTKLPSFIRAARPEQAIPLYELFLKRLAEISGLEVQSGEFGAMMAVELLNDGPVTIIMDSKRRE